MPVQAADPALRRRVAIILACVVVVLAFAFVALRHWLLQASASMDTATLVASMRQVLGACVACMVLCLLLLGRHLLLRGRRIMRDRRYPAHDARTLRDTPVSEGEAAVAIGKACRLAGLAACLLALALAVAGWFWIAQFR